MPQTTRGRRHCKQGGGIVVDGGVECEIYSNELCCPPFTGSDIWNHFIHLADIANGNTKQKSSFTSRKNMFHIVLGRSKGAESVVDAPSGTWYPVSMHKNFVCDGRHRRLDRDPLRHREQVRQTVRNEIPFPATPSQERVLAHKSMEQRPKREATSNIE